MSQIVATFKGFKRYEWWAFISFIFIAVYFLIEFQLLPLISSACSLVWVFTSSGWRQVSSDYKDILENKAS